MWIWIIAIAALLFAFIMAGAVIAGIFCTDRVNWDTDYHSWKDGRGFGPRKRK